MVKSELVKRSPLRIMEKSTHGGAGKGNLGVICSEKGAGKTACLVHIATDKLFADKHVIHVSFSDKVDHIINWYEDIFKEISKKRELENAMKVHDDLVKNRVILNFKQDGVGTGKVLNSVKALIKDGSFAADAIIVDRFDFAKASADDVAKFKALAEELAIEIWFSVDFTDIPGNSEVCSGLSTYSDSFAVIINLINNGEHMHLYLVKDHDNGVENDMHLKLDPKTMLIAEE